MATFWSPELFAARLNTYRGVGDAGSVFIERVTTNGRVKPPVVRLEEGNDPQPCSIPYSRHPVAG